MAQLGGQKEAGDGTRQKIVDANSLTEKAAGPDTPPATGGAVSGLWAVTAV